MLRMRVLQVIPSIALESSGPSYSVRRLMESLRATGCEAEILSVGWSAREPAMAHVQRFPLGPGPARLGTCPGLARTLDDRCRKRTVDILHNHGMWQMNAVSAAKAGARHKVPVVQSPRGALSPYAFARGSMTKRIFWPLFQKRALERASCFHATAQSEADDIRGWGFRQPITLIPNGIDLPDPAILSTERKRTLLYLGRLHPVKGIPDLLEAWRRIADRFPSWDVKIAGDDAGYYGKTGYRAELEALSGKLGCPRVQFVGEVNGAAKFRLMSEALLFILPSRSENFGIAVAEALAAGTASIVTHGAPWGGLDAEGAGWWVGQSVDEITAGLERAMSLSDGELVAMGSRGRSWMHRDFSWGSIGERMTATYRWLLEGGTRPECVQV
jgi:glycosyltransferase involved in cell wall biosynthesis